MNPFHSSGRRIKILFALLVSLVIASWLLFCSLPFLLNSYILPTVLENKGISQLTVQIQSLSLSSLTGNLTLRYNETESLSLPRFKLNFTLFDIVKGKLASLILDSAQLKLTVENGKLRVAGIPVDPKERQAQPESTTQLDFRTLLPVLISDIQLRNCQILIEEKQALGQVILLDGSIKPAYDTTEQPLLKGVAASLQSRGALTTSISVTAALNASSQHVELSAALQDLEQLPTILTSLAVANNIQNLSGAALLTGSATFSSDTGTFEDIRAQLQIPDFNLMAGGIAFRAGSEPFQVDLAGDLQQLDYKLGNLFIGSPLPATLTLTGTIQPSQNQFTGKGQISSDLLASPIPVSLEFGKTEQHFAGLITLSGDSQSLSVAEQEVRLGKYSFSSRITFDGQKTRLHNQFHLQSLALPHLELRAENVKSTISYSLDAENSTAEEPEIPGTLTIDSLNYKKEKLAGLNATVEQTGQGMQLKGTMKSRRPAPLSLNFEATLTPDFYLVGSLMINEQLVTAMSLPAFIKLPKGLNFHGKISAQGKIEIQPRTTNWNLQLQIKDGEVNTKDNKIKLTGISSELTFPGFENFASSPGQQLRIDTIELGGIKLTNGQVAFHLEDLQTIFIEKSRFSWCRGKVESGSLRVNINEPEISTVLYCDRLQFSELLGQLGISDASGNGSLNGRLPIFYSGKEMVFDDGFLFSTPGDSGIVRFNNTSMLRQGMGDLGQTAYLDYSLQSMENFSYNWTKLTFNTKGDDLLIAMQIDGKPAEPLPYGYSKGQLVKMKGAGIQHPIRLDVNFHLPFAQMFKYGQNLQKIMENM